MFDKIKRSIYPKVIGAVLFSYFLSTSVAPSLFLNNTPRVNPNFIASMKQEVTNAVATIFGANNLNLTSGAKTGAIILPWYYCPVDGRTCIPDDWYATPPGTSTPYPDGTYYRPSNPSWWKVETSDMTCAGLDVAYYYVWASDTQYFANLSKFVDTINSQHAPLQISEFWDSSYATNDGGPTDLHDPATAEYRYQKFIKPFYTAVPQSLWALQNNRPILTVYRFGTDTYTNSNDADIFFNTIKNLFRNDFGVEPFLVLGTEWFDKTSAKNVADGEMDIFNSGVTRDPVARSHTVNGITISNISPGGNDYRDFGSHLDRKDGQVFRDEFSQVPSDAQLLIIESWNELGEGSGMERADDYPKTGGGTLAPTIYMDILRELLGKNDRGTCRSIEEILGGPAPTITPGPSPTPQPTAPPGEPTYTPIPTATTPPGQPTNTPVPGNPTATPVPSAGKGLTIRVHKDSFSGPLWDQSSSVGVYIEGPSSNGHRFGELLQVYGSAKTSCTSRGGFPYSCPSAGTAVWKGADGTSGTAPGSYSATIFSAPTGWHIILSKNTGDLTGQSLTLDLVVSQQNLPTITPPGGNNPTPTPGGGSGSCPTTSGNSYGTRGFNPPDLNAEHNPDTVLSLRGFTPSNGELKLITYGYPQGAPPDPKAPQLSSILNNGPAFSHLYRVLPDQKDDTLAGLTANVGQAVKAPTYGYDIGQGYQFLVIYASPNELTLNGTGDDYAIEGYALHLIDFCTDPSLVAQYRQLNSAGRHILPALHSGEVVGTAKTSEVKVAVRDSGTFMDPRSRLDWWKGY